MNPSKKILSLLVFSSCLVLLASATKARADDLFTGSTAAGLCCFNVDLQKVDSTGAVIGDNSVTKYMEVTVTLTDSAKYFVDSGNQSGNHPGFAFSLAGTPTPTITASLVTI